MIVLFSDFGVGGPYMGQMLAVLAREAPGVPAITLMADAPACSPRPAAYLLPSLVEEFPAGTVFLCVVDPGVGGDRLPVVLKAGGRFFVGPGNGLFEMVARRAAAAVAAWEIAWRPVRLSSSFHGRDLFAPIAARLGRGERPDESDWALALPPGATRCPEWPDDLAEVIYLDGFGNAVTGLRASVLGEDARLRVESRILSRARTFSDVPPGTAFWYENSNGLAELAVNQGRADLSLDVAVGSAVEILEL